MKKQGVAGVHNTVNQLVTLPGDIHPLHVRASLVAGQNVVHAPHFVAALEHLHAAVFFRSRVHGDGHAAQIRRQHPVLVPVTVVLVPGPGATDFGVFHDHLGVIMIGLVLE